MTITEAAQLIITPQIEHQQPTTWADLGCGSGTFTYALSRLLAINSTIYAVDTSPQRFKLSRQDATTIEFVQADFEKDDLQLPALHGILMANSLHYVADKNSFLSSIKQLFSSEGQFIIVEYDGARANRWVPYPIDYEDLKELFHSFGYRHVVKTGERHSIYGQGTIYAAHIY